MAPRALAFLAALLVLLGSAVASGAASGVAAPLNEARPAPVVAPTTPNTDRCPYAKAPPPPVDASEVPAPGATAPAPLPRPTEAVGGAALAGCGLVQAPGSPAAPAGISAAAWVVADLDTGQVLAAKDPHGLHRPASTLKVLTSLLVLRTLGMDQPVTGTQSDADVEGSRVGVGAGGQYTVRQLLTGLLLNSGNDAAHALAVAMGGVPQTIETMNSLAKSVGALDTRAATPSGLDGPGTSTSAYDLALLFRLAMANPTFAELTATRRAQFPGYAGKAPFVINNDDKLLDSYPGALGGKPGYTDDARQTFVGAAARGGRRLVVSLLAGDRTPLLPWQQAAALLDAGFALPAGTPAVGQLVAVATPAPSLAPAATASAGPPGANAATPGAVTPAPIAPDPGAVAGRSAASNLGFAALTLLTALVAVLVLVVGDTVLRRRRHRS